MTSISQEQRMSLNIWVSVDLFLKVPNTFCLCKVSRNHNHVQREFKVFFMKGNERVQQCLLFLTLGRAQFTNIFLKSFFFSFSFSFFGVAVLQQNYLQEVWGPGIYGLCQISESNGLQKGPQVLFNVLQSTASYNNRGKCTSEGEPTCPRLLS